jgi:hypothetical protein
VTTFAAAAMIDRLVHHAEVIALKGDSYRLKGWEITSGLTAEVADRTISAPRGRGRGLGLRRSG